MKPLIITATVAVAALGGAGAMLVAAAWPDGSVNPAVPLAIAAPAAAGGSDSGSAGAAGGSEAGAGSGAAAAAAGAGSGAAAAGAAEPEAEAAVGPTTVDSAGAAGSAAEPGVAEAAAERACGLGRWPARVQGRPAGFSGGDRAGDYLWHDATGFHLRVTHRGDRRDVFTGVITADRPMALRPVRLEGRDAVALSADRRTLSFRFYDYGHIDGVDFGTNCATRLVLGELRLDGARLPAGRVQLGRTQAHPAQLPLTLTRTDS